MTAIMTEADGFSLPAETRPRNGNFYKIRRC